MNIHLPAILMFTRGTRFWPIPTCHSRVHVFNCWQPGGFNCFTAAIALRWWTPVNSPCFAWVEHLQPAMVISGFRQFSCFILKLSPHANAWESSSSSKERSATLLGCDGGFCSPLYINSPMECSSNFPILHGLHDLSSHLLMKYQDFLVV